MFKEIYNYWSSKVTKIKEVNKKNKVLIEIAACHPLESGYKPGYEFKSRLLKAIQIYKCELLKGNDVLIYIPGSKHCVQKDGVTKEDKISLSIAGKNFLIENGIDNRIIFAEDANIKYNGEKGVYNSSDECYVASKIAKDYQCDRVISIVSPVQAFRKALFYIEFGVNPQIYAVPLDNTAHNYVGELFWSLYITTFLDHSWQGEKSFLSVLTRKERCKDYVCSSVEEETFNNSRILIPKIISDIRIEWNNKYQQAREKMDNKENNNWVLIEVDDNVTSKNESLSEFAFLCKKLKSNNTKATIVLRNEKNFKKIKGILDSFNINNFEIKINNKELIDEFNSGNYSKVYCLCFSGKLMEKALNLISNGIIPMMLTIPGDKDDYINSIFRIYDKVIGKKIIDSVIDDYIDIHEVIEGLLLSQIDIENLPDVSSYYWSQNMTEGEEHFTDNIKHK